MIPIETRSMRKIRLHLLSFLFLLYLVNVLDRINLGFAALRMNAELGFNAEIFGFGAGVLFIGYLLFEIPSNFLLSHYGARLWLARIAITWGIVAVGMAFITGTTSFYVMRFVLGIAEAGFAPGAVYFVGLWVPQRFRGIALVSFIAAIPASAIVGGPLSGMLLSLGDLGGVSSWRWMFVWEGIPSILLGVLALRVLKDRPSEAQWLTSDERSWLERELAQENAETAAHGMSTFAAAASDWRVWVLAVAFFLVTMTTYGMTFWLPQIVKEFQGLSDLQVGLLSAVPFLGMLAGLICLSWLSDRRQERHFHFIAAALIGCAGIAIACLAATPTGTLAGLTVGLFGLGGAITVFWTIPMSMMTGAAAVGGFALINMIGNSAGFAGSYMIGWIRQHTQSFALALAALAGFFLLSALLVLVLRFARGPAPGGAALERERPA